MCLEMPPLFLTRQLEIGGCVSRNIQRCSSCFFGLCVESKWGEPWWALVGGFAFHLLVLCFSQRGKKTPERHQQRRKVKCWLKSRSAITGAAAAHGSSCSGRVWAVSFIRLLLCSKCSVEATGPGFLRRHTQTHSPASNIFSCATMAGWQKWLW